MRKVIYVFFSLLLANIANANTVQERLKKEYGSCYAYLDNHLYDCKPSSCTYPDVTDSKAWRAQTIVGMVDKKCYVMYYSYIGQKVIGETDHCFYNEAQLNILAEYYRNLFKSNSAVKIAGYKDKIANMIYLDCKKPEAKE